MAPSQWDPEQTIVPADFRRATTANERSIDLVDVTVLAHTLVELGARAANEPLRAPTRYDELLAGPRADEGPRDDHEPSQRENRRAAPPVIDGYAAVRRLGGGGSSDVFLYRQHAPERLVAVKILIAGLPSSLIQEEATLMAAVDHPAIVTVHTVGTAADGRGYIVMEYAGSSMAQRLRRGRVPLAAGLRTMGEVGEALEALHERGILHGDVKPGNILLRPDGTSALTDFGNAGDLMNTAVHDSAWGATVPWAPPEIFGAAGQRSTAGDVYSFTATLFTIVFGHAPFPMEGAGDVVELVRRIRSGRVEMPSRPVPDGLRELLREGLATDPAERPALAEILVRLTEISRSLPPDAADVATEHEPAVADLSRLADLALSGSDDLVREAERTIVAYEDAGRDPLAFRARWILSQALMHRGDWEQALSHLDLLWQRAAGDDGDPLRAEVDLAQGTARARLGWGQPARESLLAAHRGLQESERPDLLADCEAELGRLASRDGRAREALSWFDAALDRGTLSAPLHPHIEMERAFALRDLGRLGEAEALIESLRSSFAGKGLDALVAAADYELGLLLRRRGRHGAKARDLFLRSARAYRRLGDGVNEIRGHLQAAQSSVGLGRIEEALETYRSIRRSLADDRLQEQAAECDIRSGELLIRLGRLGEARRDLEDAAHAYRRLGSARGVADCEAQMAELDGVSGDHALAEERFARAFAAYRALGMLTEAAKCEVRRAGMWAEAARRRDGAAALRLRHRAADIAIPAALALDAGRYELDRTAERDSWATNVARDVRESAFRFAHDTGDDRLLADIVLDARSVGTYAMGAPGTSSIVPDLDAGRREDDGTIAFTASGVWRLLGQESIRLGLSPLTVTPGGHYALRTGIASAKSRFGKGVRSDVAIEI